MDGNLFNAMMCLSHKTDYLLEQNFVKGAYHHLSTNISRKTCCNVLRL